MLLGVVVVFGRPSLTRTSLCRLMTRLLFDDFFRAAFADGPVQVISCFFRSFSGVFGYFLVQSYQYFSIHIDDDDTRFAWGAFLFLGVKMLF